MYKLELLQILTGPQEVVGVLRCVFWKHGNVEIAIWENQGSSGTFYTGSTPKITYKDGEQWKEGSGFGRHDLLDLAEAAREAATKIRDLTKAQSRAR